MTKQAHRNRTSLSMGMGRFPCMGLQGFHDASPKLLPPLVGAMDPRGPGSCLAQGPEALASPMLPAFSAQAWACCVSRLSDSSRITNNYRVGTRGSGKCSTMQSTVLVDAAPNWNHPPKAPRRWPRLMCHVQDNFFETYLVVAGPRSPTFTGGHPSMWNPS
jgi:hypothetical protein